jgi:hypothetical protein
MTSLRKPWQWNKAQVITVDAPAGAGYWLEVRAYLFMITIIVLCLVMGEWYPFSNFPMYSKLASTTQCLYIAQPDGTPVFIGRDLGVQPFLLRKIYNTEIESLKKAVPNGKRSGISQEQMDGAARKVLDWFREKHAKPGSTLHEAPLKLMTEDYTIESGKVVRTIRTLAGP